MRKIVTHLRISRAIWLRGEGASHSSLLRRADAKMCCLGIYLEACGASKDNLYSVGTPSGMTGLIPADARWLLKEDEAREVSDCCQQLMEDNDLQNISEPEREERITGGFARQGITVEFTE